MSSPSRARRVAVQRRLLTLATVVTALLGLVALASDAGAAPMLRPVSVRSEARVSPEPLATTAAANNPYSLTPQDLHAIYSLPRTGYGHRTIAIVVAYDDPAAQADLNAYSKYFGLPACTAATGCFRKLNQYGAASPLPAPDPTLGTDGMWVAEASGGSEIARGVCQTCSILLVEANSANKFDLSSAVNSAARAGAAVVVVTFAQTGAPDDRQYAADYTHPNTTVVAATGDQGYASGAFFPASLPNVVAVGGTYLNRRPSGRYISETSWAMTSSGCSLYQSASAWQAALAGSAGCGSKRAVADLAAVAQPGPAVYIQDAAAPCGPSVCELDGTSAAAPIIGGMIGLAGSAGSSEAAMLYAHARSDPGAFHDITSGSNAGSSGGCGGKPICVARRGYDGPTGLGSPRGLAAFLQSGGALNPRAPQVRVSGPGNRLRLVGGGRIRVQLRNDNPFAVSGTITLRLTVRVGGRLRRLVLATRTFALDPLQTTGEQLTVARSYRGLLRQLRSVTVNAALRLRGPSGPGVTTTGRLTLRAP